MPDTFVGVAPNFPAVRAPNNADAGDTTWLQAMASDIADRTATLLARLEAIAPSPGEIVRAVQPVANDAALLAVTAHASGDLATVPGVGVFVYDATSTATPSRTVRQPTNVLSAGRWVLSPAQPLNGPVGVYGATNTATTSLSSGATINTVTLSVLAGDILLLNANASFHMADGQNFLHALYVQEAGGTPAIVASAQASVPSLGSTGYTMPMSVTGMWTVTNAGSLIVTSQGQIVLGGGVMTLSGAAAALTVLQLRP